jgi:hypothetical protein
MGIVKFRHLLGVVLVPALAGPLGPAGCFSSSGGGSPDSGASMGPDVASPDLDAAALADRAARDAADATDLSDATMSDGPSEASGPDGGVPEAGGADGPLDSTATDGAEGGVDGGPTAIRYVDVTNGLDTNACTRALPCKTIGHAMAGAQPGTLVYLADGTYGTATQGTNLTIPDGVTLAAVNPGLASLTAIALTATGSAGLDGLVLGQQAGSCSSITAASTTGTPTLTLNGVLLEGMGVVSVGGNVHATMTPGALAGGVYTAALPNSYGPMISVSGAATLLVSGGVIDGNNVGSPAFGAGLIAVTGASALTLDAVTLRKWTSVGIVTGGTATVVLQNGTLLDGVGVSGNCPTGSSIVMTGATFVTLDHSQITNGPSGGICVRSSTNLATIHLVSSTIDKTASGIASETGTGSVAAVTVTSSSLTGGTYGIYWAGLAGTAIDLESATVTGNQIGVNVVGVPGASLRVRGSSISNNTDTGVQTSVTSDLGTTADPGLNTFTANATATTEPTEPWI